MRRRRGGGCDEGGGDAGGRHAGRFVRAELRELHPYTLDQTACRFKLDQNEVPWDFPARLKRRRSSGSPPSTGRAIPTSTPTSCAARSPSGLDWPMEGVLVGNGSNELLGVTLEGAGAARRRGARRCCPRSGSTRCSCAAPAAARGSSRRAPICAADRGARAEIERDAGRPLLLCSPNNPTGAAATVEEIERLLAALDAPLLLDNAYGEFCRYDYRPLLDRHPNLLLFRTFSKAWSLAGLRLGYLLAHPDLVAELIKVKLPYNLSHAGVAGRARGARRRRRGGATGPRARRPPRRSGSRCSPELGSRCFPSEANFLLVSARPVARGGETRGSGLPALRDALARAGSWCAT